MKQTFITILMAFMVGLGLAQNQNYIHNRAIMERIPSAASTGNAIALGNLSYSEAGTVGDVYLNTDFRNATFWLYGEDKVAHGFPAKLDLQRNEFDVLMGKGNGIRALPGSKVRTFVWADSLTRTPQYFVNGGEYKDEDGTPYLGFFQILSEGELTLFKLSRVTFKPADRNPTHNTGSKDNRFIKHVDLYYAIGTKAVELPGRKGILRLMESRKTEVDKFVDVNEINFSTERHVVSLFDYYNSLVKN